MMKNKAYDLSTYPFRKGEPLLFDTKIVTNDSDFTVGGIEVLTTNPKLLRACP